MDENDDPEMCYRRGYQQGAYALYDAIAAYLPSDVRDQAQNWVNRELFSWRLKNMRGEQARYDGITADLAPPDIRLSKPSN
jgi:hypothetical protein